MAVDIFIVLSVVIYVASFIRAAILFSNKKFTGSDAAGNGMAKGMTFFYGLGIFFIVAIALVGVSIFLFSSLTILWLKYVVFVPILMPVLTFLYTMLEIGSPRQVSIEDQCHTLTFEIRTTNPLRNGVFGFKSSGGGSGSRLSKEKSKSEYTLYKSSNAIFYETGRKFQISSDDFETAYHTLDIPYKPVVFLFTDWTTIVDFKRDDNSKIELQFRYKVSK